MSNDIDGLVKTLNTIASRKRPLPRLDRIFLAFAPELRALDGFSRPLADPSSEIRESARGTVIPASADCRPAVLRA